jgi:hypothetical protein
MGAKILGFRIGDWGFRWVAYNSIANLEFKCSLISMILIVLTFPNPKSDIRNQMGFRHPTSKIRHLSSTFGHFYLKKSMI